ELVVRRQQIEVAVGLVHQLAAEAPIEWLELLLGIDQERVPVGVVAIDVPPAPQREIHLRKRLRVDRVFERDEGAAHGSPTLHSSVKIPPSSGPHGRSARASGRDTLAIVCAILPAATKRSSTGSSPAMSDVTARSPRAPAASAARTSASSRACGSSGGSTLSAGSRSVLRLRTGGRSPGGAPPPRRGRGGGGAPAGSGAGLRPPPARRPRAR